MKRLLSILLVLTMLCSFGMAFAQEEAPAEEIPAEETIEVTGDESDAEESVTEEAPAEEPAAEPVEEVPEEPTPAESADDTADSAVTDKNSDEPTELPMQQEEFYPGTDAAGETVTVGLVGSYIADAQAALDRINEIRYEACSEGVINPATNKALTLDDYVPIKWSSDLEYIARIRAAEAIITMGHIRTDGTSIWTFTTPSGTWGQAENLAWGGSDMLEAVEMWYSEKDDWVNSTGETTGHYTSMINPNYTYVGLGCFYGGNGTYRTSIAARFCQSAARLDQTQGAAQSNITQSLEVGTSYLTYTLSRAGSGILCTGQNDMLTLKGATTSGSYSGAAFSSQKQSVSILSGVTWQSSDSSVITVSADGIVTAAGSGTATVTALVNGTAVASLELTVEKGYSITYDANGGSGAPSSQTKTAGTDLALSSTIPTRTGYTFQGWAESSTATAAKYTAGGSYTTNASVTLYAVWESICPSHSYTSMITTQPTCSTPGVCTYTCSVCGDTYTENISATGDHNYTAKVATVATCTANGTRTYTCSGCGKTYTETIPATGHSYTAVVTVQPTYTQEGVRTYTCSGCGSTYTETIAKLTVTHSGTGWEKDAAGNWYYFKNSVMVQSAWVKSGSSWYYMGADGVMATGLQTISGTKYYFTSGGVMKTGWVSVGGSWYYFNTSGAAATGWLQSGSTWYYLGSDGKMYNSQWCGNYYLKSGGAMAKGWCLIGNDWYYFNSSGAKQTGWLRSGSSWYYLDPNNNGIMVYSCTMNISGTNYTFNSSGKWVS